MTYETFGPIPTIALKTVGALKPAWGAFTNILTAH